VILIDAYKRHDWLIGARAFKILGGDYAPTDRT
jgi:hypothetical protein